MAEEESLRNKTKKGLVWSALERFGTQGISALFAIFLARLLSPEDYGLVAMPMVFLSLALCFVDSGFGSALIRKPDLKDEDITTAFYFNIIAGFVCYLILFFISPLVADFYNAPILTDLLKVTAIGMFIGSFCTVQQALLTKQIDFKRQAKISLCASIVGGLIGVTLALTGFGVWALVFQALFAQCVRAILLWRTSVWRPHGHWSNESFRYLWNYGSKMLASAILDTLYINIYPIVIGKMFSKADLGNYTTANHFASLPSSNLTGVLQRVTFPVLSTIQNDDERLARNYRKILRLSAFIVFPLMMGLSSAGEPFVRVFLGDKWEGCIILLQLACFYMMFYPIHAINLDLLQVKGRSDLFLKLEIIKKVLGVAVMCLAIPHGIVVMVASGIVTSILALAINTYYTGKLINVGFFRQMRDILPIFLVGMAMWTAIILFNHIMPNMYIALPCDIVIGVILYIGSSMIFLKNDMREMISMLPASIRGKLERVVK
ncbi:MAG: lipopolysaccharide biosynthesis protein [Paludibacteraceae bacterium]|jgi:Membrane protein involved in the export of O-antigen and teichoic acid|nr:lipopolysaccharide biosynthesis protein [Paludibacteraceae bacterium]